ncbi:MAG TPA: EAL domain-containing protein [Xanthomonadaceae bacterium]|nr:EAL domain-containing protein [Xanthomonadaceae bacterium]
MRQGDAAPLKVLMVEDSAADAELLLRELRRLARPIEHRRVHSEAMLHEALDTFGPDIVLSDYSMPGFGGHDALEIVIRRSPDTPFLYVSGTIGEERAIEALQRGAWDYVLKENLRRLPASIDRALRMAAERAERAAIQRALRESEERFRGIVESSQDWIWEADAALHVTYSNPAVADVLGFTPDELHGRGVYELIDPADHVEVARRVPALGREPEGWRRWRLRWRHRDGHRRVLESTGRPLLVDDQLRGFRGICHDITERLQQEAHIRRLARIHAVLSAVGNMALRAADRDELLLAACRIAVEQGGFSAAGIGVREGDNLRVVRTYGNAALLAVAAPDEPMPLTGGAYEQHPSLHAFNQSRVVAVPDFADREVDVPPALRTTMLERGVRSQISLPLGSPPWGLLALYSDVVRVYDNEEVDLLRRLADELDYAVDFLARGERLQYLAYHNPATGLPNRAAFQQRVRTLLGRGPVAVVALDAQGFARISHSRGRDFGNALLASIGGYLQQERLEGCVAHPEADLFLLAWPSRETPEAERQWLEERLATLARRAFVVEGEQVHVLLRAGMAMGPDHGPDADTLERAAFAALADARDQGAPVRAYSEELRDRAVRRMALERDLRQAIAEEQFSLHFQPKFDAHTGALAGAEALLRWQHPREGWISPAEFIPLLEDSGLLVAVGRWVMREAIATAEIWRKRDPTLRLAVNVSARELRHAGFLDACRELLAPYAGRAPIDIEITESVIVDDVESSVQLLQALRGFGCGVAIDDFGTGYSSLNYLVRLPVDTLKIDRSFVAMLEDSPDTVTLVSNTIGLAHALGLAVVAEGVETEAQAQLLRALGCELLQGYLLGRPLPADAFASRFLAE